MLYQATNRIYQLEHGMTAADRRAYDQRQGEVAAAVMSLGHQVARVLGRVKRAPKKWAGKDVTVTRPQPAGS